MTDARRRSHAPRPVRTAPVALALAAGLALTAAGCKRPSQQGGAAAALQIRPADDAAPLRLASAVAQARPLPQTLALTGTLVPDQQSELTPLVAGRVMEVLVERGTVVRSGQPLVRLRDVDYRSNAAAASAALSQARARLGLDAAQPGARFDPENTPDVRAARSNRDLAEDALRRAEQLAGTGAMSAQDLERAQAQARAAREQYQAAVNNTRAAYFQYQNARVSVEQTNRAVADSVVRAPFDGEVAERRINVGEYVTPQRAIVTIVRTDPLRLELQIPQERIPYVRRGQEVEIAVDAYPDRVFRGTVRYISAAVRAETRSLIAEAVVPNTDGTLRPGVFVTARLNLDRQLPAVVVPAAGVLTEGGSSRVFVIDNGRAIERVVTVAERRGNEVFITRGVNAGERVATERLDRLADGARVQE